MLIPRADTEILVEQALEDWRTLLLPGLRIYVPEAGCIGLTVACERPDAEVALLELSPKAGEYCKKNILSLAPQCCFVQADVLKNTAGLANMDAVLSNPPYIPSATCLSCSEKFSTNHLWRWMARMMDCVFTGKFPSYGKKSSNRAACWLSKLVFTRRKRFAP